MLEHKHIIVNASVRKPIVSEEEAVDWMKRLVEAVGMNLAAGPVAKYVNKEGNEGITCCCCIETSHTSLHLWDKLEIPILKFDLYSCKDFNVEDVVKMIMEMDPYHYNYILIDRARRFKILDRKRKQVIGGVDLLEGEEKEFISECLKIPYKERTKEQKKAVAKFNKLNKKFSI